MDVQHMHLKYKICVSGAAETGHCAPDALDNAKILGAEIIRRGAVLVNGATTGFPYWSAIGAKEAGGFTIGLSPANSEREHVEKYNLPLDYMDVIIYTGFGYSGRNLLLTRTADAVIVGCGRWGTINEFTIALEDEKPIGVLEGAGGSTEVIKDIIEKSKRGPGNIVYDSDPVKLVSKVFELVKKEKMDKI
jgi:uncharacterized protein (TIGR00725 family)